MPHVVIFYPIDQIPPNATNPYLSAVPLIYSLFLAVRYSGVIHRNADKLREKNWQLILIDAIILPPHRP